MELDSQEFCCFFHEPIISLAVQIHNMLNIKLYIRYYAVVLA